MNLTTVFACFSSLPVFASEHLAINWHSEVWIDFTVMQ